MGLGGFFKGVGRAISRPVRGIGRIARGNFREGLGDIGHGIKRGAQAAALVGSGGTYAPLLAAAGGGMLERGTEEGASFGNVMGAGIRGASGAVAARGIGNTARSIGGALRGGQQLAAQVPGAPGAFQLPDGIDPTFSMGGGAPPNISTALTRPSLNPSNIPNGSTISSLARPNTSSVTSLLPGGQNAQGLGSRIGGALKSAAGYAEEHPNLAKYAGDAISASVGTPTDDINQRQQDRLDEQWALQNDPEERRRRLFEGMIMNGAWRG